MQVAPAEAELLKAGKKDFDFEQDIVKIISAVSPVEDFKRMIAEKTEDLTDTAID